MAEYQTRLTRSEKEARGALSFVFDKPKNFNYQAGQHVTLRFFRPDGEEQSHTFTLSSAPAEEELAITTRMRDSEFKRALEDLSAGADVRLQGPSGDLTLPSDDKEEAVFIAGGIGITPFRSMLRQAGEENRPGPITLFFSDHQPRDAAFLDELDRLSRELKNVTLVATMTAMDESEQAWDGEIGHIDADMIRRHLEDIGNATFYLAGPPGMVDSMRDMLREAGVRDERIAAEQFAGY